MKHYIKPELLGVLSPKVVYRIYRTEGKGFDEYLTTMCDKHEAERICDELNYTYPCKRCGCDGK